VLCVNGELSMTKGKIAAQAAHGAVGALQQLQRAGFTTLLRAYERGGQPKIALRVPTTEELVSLARAARAAGLPTYVVQDAGRTQIAAGSRTVLAIGPAPRSAVDAITGGLKLL